MSPTISPYLGAVVTVAKNASDDNDSPTHAAVTRMIPPSSSLTVWVRSSNAHGVLRKNITSLWSLSAPFSSTTTYATESLSPKAKETYVKHVAFGEVTFAPVRSAFAPSTSSHAYRLPSAGSRVMCTEVTRSPRHSMAR